MSQAAGLGSQGSVNPHWGRDPGLERELRGFVWVLPLLSAC